VEYRSLEERFDLPQEAKEFRVVLKLRKGEEGACSLYMDDFRVERRENNPTAQ